MGTRADFYVGTGKDAEWLGSLAFDGDRIADMQERHAAQNADCAACWAIQTAKTEEAYRKGVADLLAVNDDATLPSQGWPWPWNDSRLTDRVYAFADGATALITEDAVEWPDMSARKNVTLGKRSGLIIVGAW